MGAIPLLTVSEISSFVKDALEAAMPLISVVGEVSNLSYHSSGHLYFSLKDNNGLIKVVCFKQSALGVDFKLENGLKVVVTGMLTAYIKSSNYQIVAEKIEKTGVGALHKLFEELKQKLAKEGLFDEIHKKPLPSFPRAIGLITAEGGAVLHDIITTANERMPCKIILYKSTMQGVKTAPSVISGIDYFNFQKEVDVIIIARGGGSFEDLFEFNNEELIRCAFASRIPIISAIGHETDFTLLDLVADKRAPTPTASIVIALKSRREFLNNMEQIFEVLRQTSLFCLKEKYVILKQLNQKLKEVKFIIEKKQNLVNTIFTEIKNISIKSLMKTSFNLQVLKSEISSYDIEDVMQKGFALVYKNGIQVTSVQNLKKGEEVSIYLKDGKKETTIL